MFYGVMKAVYSICYLYRMNEITALHIFNLMFPKDNGN